MDVTTAMAGVGPQSRGRSAEATGQIAKMAVSMARDGGADLPKSAQGIAASGIARGLNFDAVVASLISAEAPTDTPSDPVDADIGVAAEDGMEEAATEGSDGLILPEVTVETLADPGVEAPRIAAPEAVSDGLADLAPVPAETDVPVQQVSNSMAGDVARDALEMLFGQASQGEPG